MSNTPFPSLAPDFSDPLGLLHACHERILQHTALLEWLASQLQQQAPDSEIIQTAGRIHRYFSTAAQHHHEDEEQDIFPLLARQSLKLAEQVHQLRQQHQQLETLWQAVAPQLQKPAAITDTTAFADACQALASAYKKHVELENGGVLEVAQHIFSQDELRQIGRRMAERRGLRG